MVELLKKIIHKSLGKLGSVQIVSAKYGMFAFYSTSDSSLVGPAHMIHIHRARVSGKFEFPHCDEIFGFAAKKRSP